MSRRCSIKAPSSPTPFRAQTASFPCAIPAVPFSSRRPLLPAPAHICTRAVGMSLSILLVRSHFPPDTLVADLYDHLGFAISFGVAMRSCICPVSSPITQPISAASFGLSSHTLISIVATELVSTLPWSFRVAAANPRPRRGCRAGFSPRSRHNYFPMPPPSLQYTLLQPAVAPSPNSR